jgi:hypothetical protein
MLAPNIPWRVEVAKALEPILPNIPRRVEIAKALEPILIPGVSRRGLGTSEYRQLGADAGAEPDGQDDQSYPGNHHRDQEPTVGPASMKFGVITFAASLKACHHSLHAGHFAHRGFDRPAWPSSAVCECELGHCLTEIFLGR